MRSLRGEDVELVGVEDQLAVAARAERLPIVLDPVGADLLEVDDVGVALGAVADDALRLSL